MLDRQIADQINNSVLDKGDLVSKVNAPATDIQIEKLKSIHSLPGVFYDLLRFSNGMELFNYKDLDGYNFYSVDKLIKENKELINAYEERWTEMV